MTHLINRWLAVQVKTRFEKAVAGQLVARGYEQFVPTYVKRQVSRTRAGDIELPLIPGYVFCRFSRPPNAHIVTTPGVIRVVSSGTTWLPVEDHEIDALQRVVVCRMAVQPWFGVRIGQEVEIATGPLLGVRGVLLRLGGGRRVVITIRLLQRSVAVEIDQDSVVAVPDAAGDRCDREPAGDLEVAYRR